MLLKINNVDFTGNVVMKKYDIQKKPVVTTWTDGNFVTHQDTVRTRISGKIPMTFLTEADYNAFNNAIAAVKTSGGYCPIVIYVNNTKELLTINAFLDYETKLVWTQRWSSPQTQSTPEISSVTVTVTER